MGSGDRWMDEYSGRKALNIWALDFLNSFLGKLIFALRKSCTLRFGFFISKIWIQKHLHSCSSVGWI